MSVYCPAVETGSQDPRHRWVYISRGVDVATPAYAEEVCGLCGAVRVFVTPESWDRAKAALDGLLDEVSLSLGEHEPG